MPFIKKEDDEWLVCTYSKFQAKNLNFPYNDKSKASLICKLKIRLKMLLDTQDFKKMSVFPPGVQPPLK